MVKIDMAPFRAISKNEDGWLLIEVIMGAVLVLVVSLGLLSGFDSSTRASSINKQRSVASDLAQADQEHLRSFTVTHLSNWHATNTSTVGGVVYTVNERATWVGDTSGLITCTAANQNASYIQITSSVTWKGMGITPPVTAQSLVSPPVGTFGAGQGSADLQITDSKGNGVPGLSVSFGGPGAFNDVTDTNGCVVFGYVPSGSYVGSVSRGGWVDPGGNNPGTRPCSVPDGGTIECQQSFDRAGTVDVHFDTKAYGSSTATNTSAQNVIFSNPGMVPATTYPPINGFRMFPGTVSSGYQNPGGTPPTITAGSLFPFHDNYGIYAGICTADDPTTVTGNPNYYTTNPGGLLVGPGAAYTGPTAVTVREPSLNVTVMTAAGAPAVNAVVTLQDTGCGNTRLPDDHTDASGHLQHPGVPFGTYKLCAQQGSKRTSVNLPSIVNSDPNGTTPTTVTMSSNGSSCP
jgi:hypothetical protein